MDMEEILIGLSIILVINFLDIEIDSRAVIRKIRDGNVPPSGSVKHFFEGIIVFWLYIMIVALLVGIFDISIFTILPYFLLVLAFRLIIHPLYFALRVVVPESGDKSKWNHLGTTSATDRLIRTLGFTEKNHYFFRVVIFLVLIVGFAYFRFSV